MNLAAKLTVLFLLVTIAPLGIVSYLAFENGRQTIEQNTFDSLTRTTLLKEAQFNQWVEDTSRSLRRLAQRPLVGGFAATMAAHDPADPEYQQAHSSLHADHLDPWIQIERGIESLFILRASDGLILASTDEAFEGKYRENEPFFMEGKSATYVQDLTYSLSLREPVMTVATPVHDEDGSLIAVLAGHVDLARMSEILAQGRDLSDTEETYLVNTFNFLVTESRFDPDAALTQAVYSDAVQDCLAHRAGSGFYDDYRGVPVMGVYRWMPEYRLCILTEVDQAEAFAPINDLRNTVLKINATVAVVVSLAGVLFARTITGPVQQLLTGVQAVGRGNLDYRIEIGGKDEIGQLTRAFKLMTTNLKEITASRDELNREMAERRRVEQELVRINQRLSDAQRIAHLGSWEMDIATGKSVWSDEFIRICGLEPDSLDPTVDIEEQLIHPDDRQAAQEAIQRVIAGGSAYHIEKRIIRPNGEVRYVLSRGEIVMGDKGQSKRLIRSFLDITERKQIEQQLQESEERARTIIQNLPGTLIHIFDREFRYVFNDGQGMEQLGLSNEMLVGRSIHDVLDLDTANNVEENYRRVLNGETVKFEGDFDDQSFLMISAPLRNREEEVVQILTLSIDITDRKRREKQIEYLNEALEDRAVELEAANKELEAFSYSVSHDLRAPLRAIGGFSQALLEDYMDKLDAEGQSYLQRVRSAANRMSDLIDDLLNLSRLTRAEMRHERVDLSQLAQSIASGLHQRQPERQVEFTISEGLVVDGDTRLLRIALENLLGNAWKFTSKHPQARIEVGIVEQSENGQAFFVRDDGDGFDMVYVDKLFGAFQRLHAMTEFEGTGIGLATVQRIIRRHGGKVWAEAEVGKGATFFFTL